MNSFLHNPADGKVLAAFTDDAALIRVTGRGTFRVAPAFRQAIQAAGGANVPLLIVDLAECTTMDSTFMGAIASVGLAGRNNPATRAVFINVSATLLALLKGLGVDRILCIYPTDSLPAEIANLSGMAADLQFVDAATPSKREAAVMMYDAHETLTRVHPENMQKFQHVLACLQRDIKKTTTPGDPA